MTRHHFPPNKQAAKKMRVAALSTKAWRRLQASPSPYWFPWFMLPRRFPSTRYARCSQLFQQSGSIGRSSRN